MKLFYMIKPYLNKYKSGMIAFILISLVSSFISIGLPYLTGTYIDNLIKIHKVNYVYIYTSIFVALSLIQIMISYVYSIVVTKLKTNVSFELNFSTLEHVKRLPLFFFKDINASYLNQRINSDANAVSEFVIDNSINIFVQCITMAICFYILAKINKIITIILILLIPIYICIYFLFSKPLYKVNYEMKENQNKFFSKMNEQLYNIKYIKVNSIFDILAQQLWGSYKKLLTSIIKLTKTSFIFSGLGSLTNTIANVLIIFFGGIEIVSGKLTIGEFTIINVYFNLIISSAGYFLNLTKSYQNALVSYNRLFEICSQEVEKNGKIYLNNIKSIELRDLCFTYDGKNMIINKLNKVFNKGKVYIIAGKNGAGKSTLMNLIIGIYSGCYDGEILYNSVNVEKLDLYKIRRELVGMTEQEPILINDSIINNLTLGLKEIKYDKVTKWCNRIGIYELIKSMPSGFNSMIEEKSTNLSGGEKQKLSQARVLIKDPQILIFDEPTSALDADSIIKFKTLINEIKNDKIIFIVTHDDDIFDISDEVLTV